MADAVLAIRIVTDYAQGQKGLAAATSGVGKLQRGLSKMVAPAAIALGAMTVFGKAAVDAASRTQQAMGAVESVFGRNAGQVKRWADAAAGSVGLAKSEYMELASVIGAQLKNMGVPLDQVAGKTNKLVELGSDLAATYGGTTKEAVEALGSALRGETDPIERYGVSIKQADINAQMAADGTDNLTGKAAKQARTMTLLAMVTKQSADAHGQFAEEQGTAAGQAQIAAANFENMKSALGTALLPLVTRLTSMLGKLAVQMAKHKNITLAVIAVIALMSVAILALNVAVSIYVGVTTLAASATVAAWVAVLWPILAVVAVVAAVVAVVVILWKKFPPFRNAVIAVWNAIRGAAMATGRAIMAAGRAIERAWRAAGQAISSSARAAFNAVRNAVGTVVGAVQRLIAKIRSIKVPGFIRAAFHAITSAVSAVVARVGNLVASLRNIKVPGGVTSALHAIKSAADAVWSAIQRVVSALKSIPTPHINWPSPPKWLSKVVPGSFMVTPPGPPGQASLGHYVAPTGRSGRLAGRGLAPVAPGPTIVVQGALDPEAVARQIGRILGGHTRRMGGAAA